MKTWTEVGKWVDSIETGYAGYGTMMDMLHELADPENEEASDVFLFLNSQRTIRQLEIEKKARAERKANG
jgi:hypothetical protein